MTASSVSPERRRDLLSQQIQNEVARGGRIESRGDYDATVVFGHRVNHVLHLILSLVTLGLWVIVWIIVSLTGGEKRTLIVVDEFGRVNIQKVSGGFSPLMLIPIALLILVVIALNSHPATSQQGASTAESADASVAGVHQEPVTVSGTGIEKSAPFHLEAGNYLVTWTATPSSDQGCYHGATLSAVDPNAPVFEMLANELLKDATPKSGQTRIYNLRSGDYYINGTSGCAWSFTFTQQ